MGRRCRRRCSGGRRGVRRYKEPSVALDDGGGGGAEHGWSRGATGRYLIIDELQQRTLDSEKSSTRHERGAKRRALTRRADAAKSCDAEGGRRRG